MHKKRIFTAGQLGAWNVPNGFTGEGAEVLESRFSHDLDHTRAHWCVFIAPDDGQVWKVFFQKPNDEYGACHTWFGDDKVTGTRVRREAVITVEWCADDVDRQDFLGPSLCGKCQHLIAVHRDGAECGYGDEDDCLACTVSAE